MKKNTGKLKKGEVLIFGRGVDKFALVLLCLDGISGFSLGWSSLKNYDGLLRISLALFVVISFGLYWRILALASRDVIDKN